MTNNPSQNPRLQFQSSIANNRVPSANTPPPMSGGSYYSQASWNNLPDQAFLSPQTSQQYNAPRLNAHKRLSSESSITSTGPDSPYTQSSAYPHIVDLDTSSANSPHFESYDGIYGNASQFGKPLFAPTNTLNNGSLFNSTAFQTIDQSGYDAASVMVAQNARRQAMAPRRGHLVNGGQSSSHGSTGGEYDTSSDLRSNVASLDRTTSNAYEDELYNPSLASSAQATQSRHTQSQGNLLSPSHRSVFSDRLQAANTARSASPAANIARERSPFRDSSEYATLGFSHSNPSSPDPRVSSTAQMRVQQKIEADAQAYAQHHPPQQRNFIAPRTISPKEALLDCNETEDDAKMPLFPHVKQEPEFTSVNASSSQNPRRDTEETNTDQSYASMATTRRPSSNFSSSQQSNSSFTFLPPAVSAMTQQYPFISQSRRQNSSMQGNHDQIPDFPASLTSMESTKSESGQQENVRLPAFGSQESSQTTPPRRPSDTTAHSGSYTCTASGCTARFDTSVMLQKHRREAHRSSPQSASTPSTPLSATASSNAQAAANNVPRNNRPGPHKCERTNPSTGKPCNTIFSRSYDLTRHEDTIHNNRKQKVRCHLCTEEKTFSRSDALTRHMRVVHPDVDYPGKTRRGRN